MPSERVQRQIDRLLDEAEAAAARRDWAAARERAEHALTFDPDNEDAKALLAAADRGLAAPGHAGGEDVGGPLQPVLSQGEGPPAAGPGRSPDANIQLPTSFASGRYRVQRFLGEGGRKRVYLAHDTRLDRDVALAVIKTEGLDIAGLARVRNEAQAMARLGDHPNIVTVFDVLEEAAPGPRSRDFPALASAVPYIVSQYMAGGSVEDLIAKAEDHRLPTDEVLSIATQVCAALDHAHRQGIVHRDLKPGNVWLTALTPNPSPTRGEGSNALTPTLSQKEREDVRLSGRERQTGPVSESASDNPLSPGERARVRGSPEGVGPLAPNPGGTLVAKLGDFGLAVALDRSRVTMAGMMLGTVAYMPPEQALGGESTPKADLYSLGCMLYEMVTGRPPFLGEDPTAVISQHINTPPVAPSWLTDRCPPALEEIILHLLAKAPDARPESAAQVRGALAKVDPTQKSASHSDSTENPLDRLARGVFVGRSAELEKLRKAFDEAFAGHGSLVMLVGEPGIGKTRTAQELETYARMRGAQVLWGRTHESSGAPPYWPWYQVGNAYAATNDLAAVIAPQLPPGAGAELSRIFTWLRQQPNFVEPEPITDPESAQFRLFEAYAAFIRAMATQTPLLIALDDLHWADKPTLLLLQHLGRELSRLRVLIVGNYRDTDLSRTHPLSEALAGLNRDPGFARVVLRGLTQPEVAAYIRVAANVEPKPELVRRIFEETEGNPFFLSEVVNLMAQEGTLTRESVSDIRIPDGVREALGRRLDHISPEANELLQMCAIAGREFTYDTLTLTGDRDENQLLRLIEEALKARVIEEMGQAGRYRFTHALMQETLLDELSTTRRVRLHGQVGEALERRWGDSLAAERAPRLAHHFVEAAMLGPGQARKAVLYSKLAAEQAEAQSAYDEAARHYESCLTLVTEADDRLGEDEAALLAALGRCHRNSNRQRDAWRSLMRAITIYRQRDDPQGVATTTLEAALVVAPADRHRANLTAALDLLGQGDPHLEARLLSQLLWSQPPGTSERGLTRQRLTALSAAHGFDDIEADLLQDAAREAFRERNVDEGARLSRAAFQRFDALGRTAEAVRILGNLGEQLLSPYGRLDDAKEVVEEARAYAGRHHIRYWEDNTTLHLAAVLLARCEFQAFDELLSGEDSRPNWNRANLRAMRAEMAGDLSRASALLPDVSLAGGLSDWMSNIHSLRARVLWEAADIEAARFEFSRLREVEDALPGPRVDGVLVSGPSIAGVDEALPFLADAAFMHAAATWALQAPVADFKFNYRANRSIPGVLARVLLHEGHIEKAEEYFRIALEWCERERCPVEAGRCLLGLAEVAERRGETREALAHLDRAIALFQQHGARLYLDRALALKLRLQGIGSGGLRTSIDAVTAAVEAERPALPAAAVAPDGTVTIMFSDIEDSTILTERLGDQAWMALLQKHNDLIRTQLRAHGGFEVKTIGDGFMVAFQGARRALECAIAIQRAIAAWPDPTQAVAPLREAARPGAVDVPFPKTALRIRIGLHAGEAVRDRDDFYGKNVILASRIGGQALGGQVLVSSLLKELTESSGEFVFDGGRQVELKGLAGKQRVFEVKWT